MNMMRFYKTEGMSKTDLRGVKKRGYVATGVVTSSLQKHYIKEFHYSLNGKSSVVLIHIDS